MRAWLIILTMFAAGLFVAALIAETTIDNAVLADRARIAQLQARLTAIRADLARVAVTDRQANVSHLGLCFQTDTDPSTGDLDYVLLVPPQATDGVPSCPAGSFVSIVPGRH